MNTTEGTGDQTPSLGETLTPPHRVDVGPSTDSLALHGVLDLDLMPASGSGRAAPTYEQLEQACAVEFPRLVRLLTAYCGDRETALDLAQETMARGCAHWHRVARMDDQRAWFTRVALNLANSRWRRLRLERRFLDSAQPPTSETHVVDLDAALTVRRALARLTSRQRAAVVLRYFDDLDLTATAAIMGCSTGTVKKLTARGLASLRLDLDFDDTSGDWR